MVHGKGVKNNDRGDRQNSVDFNIYVVPVKSKVEILQHFVAFSEYMNFNYDVGKTQCSPSDVFQLFRKPCIVILQVGKVADFAYYLPPNS